MRTPPTKSWVTLRQGVAGLLRLRASQAADQARRDLLELLADRVERGHMCPAAAAEAYRWGAAGRRL